MNTMLTTTCRNTAFALLITISPALMAKPKLVIKSGAGICEAILQSEIVNGLADKSQIGATQAQRIHSVLSKMTPDQQKALFESFKTNDLVGFAQRIRVGKLTAQEKAELAKIPGAEVLIQDFAQVSDSFPGIFALQNAGVVILKSVEIIHRQEMAAKAKNVDLMASLSQAARMKRTLENSMINIVLQADGEYRKSWLINPLHRLRRWWTPLLHPINSIIEWMEDHTRELKRMQLIDKLAVDLFLADSLTNGATDDEIKQALDIILDSPKELELIKNAVRKTLFAEFENGKEIEAGKVDIYKAAALVTERDLRLINEKFDAANIRALQKLNDLINAIRVRKGLGKRQAKDFQITELQLYKEAFSRRVGLYSDFYSKETEKETEEEYKVEESYWEQEFSHYETYTDSNGKSQQRAVYVSVQKWRWITVIPSFEDVISQEFEEGDRGIRGLDDIIIRTKALAKKEGRPREALQNAETLISNIHKGWINAVTKGEERDDFLKDMTTHIAYLQTIEDEQKIYAEWPEHKIKRQYDKDSEVNFRARNAWILKRVTNAKQLLQQLHELMTQNILESEPSYDLFDVSKWLYNLENKASWNMWSKIFLGTSPAAAAGYSYYDPRAANQVADWMAQFMYYVQHIMP